MKQLAQLLLLLAFAGCNKEISTPSVWKRLSVDAGYVGFERATFIDENSGFIGGGRSTSLLDPVLVVTDNGGVSWSFRRLSPPTANGFGDIFRIQGSNVMFAAGVQFNTLTTKPTALYRSADLANTWQLIDGNYKDFPGGFYFFNDLEGSMIYNGPYKTADGGVTWIPAQDPDGINFFGVSTPKFITRQVGYAYGGALFDNVNFGTLIKSTDGGETWRDITRNFKGNLSYVTSGAVINESTVFVFCADGKVISTSDGGGNWSIKSKVPITVFDCYFIDGNEGYIVGQIKDVSGMQYGIYVTDDGGQTWKPQLILIGEENLLSRITFPSKSIGYAVSKSGIYKQVKR